MPDNPELIERYDAKFRQLLTDMHNDGLRYEVIKLLLNESIMALDIIEKAESSLTRSEGFEKAP